MHIPFSMSDEPDLGDEFRSYLQEDEWFVDLEDRTPTLYTEAQVNNLLREQARKMIDQHVKVIDAYRKEILELQWRLEGLEK